MLMHGLQRQYVSAGGIQGLGAAKILSSIEDIEAIAAFCGLL